VLALSVAAAVLLVHDLHYDLTKALWLDEAWVALSTRAPLVHLGRVTSSTPLGFTFLLRLVPGGGLQDLRLLPLLFAALAALCGYLLGEELGLLRYVSGILVGAAVLLSPAMLVRNDLKQYTAEAFVAMAILLAVAKLETSWSRGRLAALAALTAAGLLVANSAVFVGVAAFAGLGVQTLIRRDMRRFVEAVAAGLCAGVGALVVYLLADARHVNSTLTAYWNGFYVPHRGVSGAVTFLHQKLDELAPYMGFRHLFVDLLLVLGGLATLVVLRRYALAVTVPAAIGLVIVASAAKKYPFGDLRTSTFWLVMLTALMGVAAAGLANVVAMHKRPVGFAVVAASLVVWVATTDRYIRSHTVPNEDVRAQVDYLNAHRHPGDVVIVGYGANWGFGYYERDVKPSFAPFPGIGYIPVYPDEPWIVQMDNRNPSDVLLALARATALAESEDRQAGANAQSPGPGPGVRIWIVRSHQTNTEATTWKAALAGKDVEALGGGPEPILLYQPHGGSGLGH
jgi:hypothetical protein